MERVGAERTVNAEVSYPYIALGKLQYTVHRFAGKEFRAQGPDGRWSLSGRQRYLYKYDELETFLKDSAHGVVWICAGEKDCTNLWAHGLPATTYCFGENSWEDFYSDQLKELGARAAIIPHDCDETGRQAAQKIGQSLASRDIKYKILELGLHEHQDVSDYLKVFSKEDLIALARATPEGQSAVNFLMVAA